MLFSTFVQRVVDEAAEEMDHRSTWMDEEALVQALDEKGPWVGGGEASPCTEFLSGSAAIHDAQELVSPLYDRSTCAKIASFTATTTTGKISSRSDIDQATSLSASLSQSA